MSDLAVFTLHVRPTHADVIPAHQGRAAHAAFLQAIGQINPALAAILHESDLRKPFTCSPLLPMPRGEMLRLSPRESYTLRYTTLHTDLTRIAINALPALWEGGGVMIHDQPLIVEHVEIEQTRYGELMAISSKVSSRRVRLNFTTPTQFKKTGGLQMPLPLPSYVFGSLADAWETFAPDETALPADLRAWIDAAVTIEAATLHTETVSFQRANRGTTIGFVGQVTFAATSAPPGMLAAFHTLARYAAFAGVGAKTPMGFGQVALVSG